MDMFEVMVIDEVSMRVSVKPNSNVSREIAPVWRGSILLCYSLFASANTCITMSESLNSYVFFSLTTTNTNEHLASDIRISSH